MQELSKQTTLKSQGLTNEDWEKLDKLLFKANIGQRQYIRDALEKDIKLRLEIRGFYSI